MLARAALLAAIAASQYLEPYLESASYFGGVTAFRILASSHIGGGGLFAELCSDLVSQPAVSTMVAALNDSNAIVAGACLIANPQLRSIRYDLACSRSQFRWTRLRSAANANSPHTRTNPAPEQWSLLSLVSVPQAQYVACWRAGNKHACRSSQLPSRSARPRVSRPCRCPRIL